MRSLQRWGQVLDPVLERAVSRWMQTYRWTLAAAGIGVALPRPRHVRLPSASVLRHSLNLQTPSNLMPSSYVALSRRGRTLAWTVAVPAAVLLRGRQPAG